MFLHHKQNKYSSGFTLIELLVVIAVIGLLSSIIFSSLATSREKAYNAQILQEKHQLEIALQTYYNQNGYLPAPSNAQSTGIYLCVGYYANCVWPNKSFTAPSNSLTLNRGGTNTIPYNDQLALLGQLSNGGQLQGYIPSIYFTQSVFVSNIEYRGIIYDCYSYISDGKCGEAAVYYPMFGVQGNARCNDGVNSIISQSIMDPSRVAPTPTATCPNQNANSI